MADPGFCLSRGSACIRQLHPHSLHSHVALGQLSCSVSLASVAVCLISSLSGGASDGMDKPWGHTTPLLLHALSRVGKHALTPSPPAILPSCQHRTWSCSHPICTGKKKKSARCRLHVSMVRVIVGRWHSRRLRPRIPHSPD